jgi:hypothetical protein
VRFVANTKVHAFLGSRQIFKFDELPKIKYKDIDVSSKKGLSLPPNNFKIFIFTASGFKNKPYFDLN